MTKAEVLKQNKSNEFDFEKDLSINKFKLDEECLSHSSIYFRYAEAQQKAKSEVSRLKDKLEIVTAEANIRIRSDLIEKGIKFTEALVTSHLTKDEEVLSVKEELREAEEINARLSVAVTAMEHRKAELDNLVKLYCSGYFSVANGGSEVKKGINEQTSNAVRKNLNRKGE